MILLVNIIDEEYERLKRSNFHTVVEECVRNGIPLEQIRDEIHDILLDYTSDSESWDKADEIINKYR